MRKPVTFISNKKSNLIKLVKTMWKRKKFFKDLYHLHLSRTYTLDNVIIYTNKKNKNKTCVRIQIC